MRTLFVPTIRLHDDPLLYKTHHPDVCLTEARSLARLLEQAVAIYNGAGLAAPQLGISKRAIVIKPGKIPTVMLNPVIVWKSPEMVKDIEGCLSFPDVFCEIERHKSIKVSYYDGFWRRKENELFVDFTARIIQHEVDHLNGICLVGDFWRKQQ